MTDEQRDALTFSLSLYEPKLQVLLNSVEFE